MQSLAEGRDGVYRLFVIETKNGVDAPRELRTNCGGEIFTLNYNLKNSKYISDKMRMSAQHL